VPIPALTEERRRDLVKVMHKLAEEGRVGVRHARHEALAQLKKIAHVSEDEKKHAEKDVQKVTDDHIKHLDELVEAKEAEIMEV
jgi:ribosome recycling factor